MNVVHQMQLQKYFLLLHSTYVDDSHHLSDEFEITLIKWLSCCVASKHVRFLIVNDQHDLTNLIGLENDFALQTTSKKWICV